MQSLEKPRIYFNVVEWLMSKGLIQFEKANNEYSYTNDQSSNWEEVEIEPSLFTTIPGKQKKVFTCKIHGFGEDNLNVRLSNQFVALLGHNLSRGEANQDGNAFYIGGQDNYPYEEIANVYDAGGGGLDPQRSGFSISKLEWRKESQAVTFVESCNGDKHPKACSIILGSFYDFPLSPDLNIQTNIEMDGVKKIKTKGGATLVNRKYLRSPNWGDLAPWQIKDQDVPENNKDPRYARVGRKTWHISWSFISDRKLFPISESAGLAWNDPYLFAGVISDTDGYTSDDVFENSTLTESTLTDSDTFLNMIMKLNGTQLSFIFQPNSDNCNYDQFYVCKLASPISFKATAHNMYSIALKITEVW